MNIHPIIVHFPIALLIVYAGIEVVSLFSQKRAEKLATTKLICLWIGVLWSFAALSSGEWAEELYWRSALIHTHEEFAEKSHALYVVLALFYVTKTFFAERLQLSRILYTRWLQRIVAWTAVVWVVILSIVGALGGAIARGTGHGDPVSDWAVATFVGVEWENRGSEKKAEVSEQNKNNNEGEDQNNAQKDSNPVNLPRYSMDIIKEHKEEVSCWTTINGIVYDLTAFINKHPGGDKNILRICWKDGTEAFTRKHGGQEKPEMILQWFEIRVLLE